MVYDTIDSYRLNQSIVEGYLRRLFGNYKFYVEVSYPYVDVVLGIADRDL